MSPQLPLAAGLRRLSGTLRSPHPTAQLCTSGDRAWPELPSRVSSRSRPGRISRAEGLETASSWRCCGRAMLGSCAPRKCSLALPAGTAARRRRRGAGVQPAAVQTRPRRPVRAQATPSGCGAPGTPPSTARAGQLRPTPPPPGLSSLAAGLQPHRPHARHARAALSLEHEEGRHKWPGGAAVVMGPGLKAW
ncbi:PREDICTED: uncharacterized protein LOC106146659 isoform X2 [Chinchilla lanigera]|uniref:uncharacterized protein LOC106146659 isoform X2 n=1 Tax=Chinchilla lanigera TaxID=34839 RepID=UPI000696AE46|nr:PREDICTED: uncharacterized protein LOC106146659 isoform X2 [Chinchilla lanigera]